MTARPEVLVAMSGGVDSSVAAALLLERGFAVTGVTMKLWGGDSDSGCCSVSDVDDARRVADQLGIDHHVFNFGDDFDERVVQPYVDAYASGITPNPCIECNRHLKFDRLLRRADALGFTMVATGHHARVVSVGDSTRRMARGADPLKDQSYVLYMLRQPELARILLPIGDIDKAHVRAIASRFGLRTATKPDSQDVCFITAVGGREKFLGDRIPLRAGRIVDTAGNELGRVPAVELVTIGQRKGLDLAGAERRRFVVDVDVASATVVVGSREDLDRDTLAVSDVVWSHVAAAGPCLVQCSAHGEPGPATIEVVGPHQVTVRWDEPQRLVAPGQSAVFYEGDTVLGGGIVQR
ncbi:MAG TPA: tRNA 2-thiouridine(34) synthase MnmA [Acidimicrobiales bacterium]|nr:tRNA 2-thiouridine(34) synthase MnmA [Acidimicrobiales bacterium]